MTLMPAPRMLHRRSRHLGHRRDVALSTLTVLRLPFVAPVVGGLAA
jgi:hypothetical protein